MEMIGKGHETAVCGTSIAWGEMGGGDPLVLLHGLQDSHRTWRRAAPLLARHFRVLMPDLPGFGCSGRPDAPYTLSWHAQMVAAWMDALGLKKAHLCGHSFGGGIAQWMVLEQRKRVDRLALVSAGGLGRGVGVGLRFVTFPVLGRMLTPLALKHILPIVLRRAPEVFGHMEPEEVERFIRWTRIPGTNLAFQRSVEGVINFLGQHMQTVQRIDEVEEVPPTALFWGDKDPIIPVRHGRNALEHSVGVALTIYNGCGHFPQLDAYERFSRDLIEFICDPARRPARIRALPRKRQWQDFFSLPTKQALSS